MALAVVMVSLVASGACSKRLLVGVVLPESGDAAVYAASLKEGIALAFDEAQAAATAPTSLEVRYLDSGSDPARAVSAAESLYDEGAVLIIGGATSLEAKAMIPLADTWGRVLLSPSASAPELSRQSVFFFRVFPSDELEGVKAADLLVHTRGARTVLILEEDNTYTRGLLRVFMGELKNQGGRVIASVRVGDPEWQEQARIMLAARRPAAVYVCGYGEAIVEALQVLRAASFPGVICTTSAITTSSFLKRAGRLAEGVFLPLASVDAGSKEEPARGFAERYQQVYSRPPDIYAAAGYDAALATLYALEGLGPRSSGEVPGRLRALAARRGVTGPLAFDELGNIKRVPRSHWIHNGSVEDYDAYLAREQEHAPSQEEAPPRGRGGMA